MIPVRIKRGGHSKQLAEEVGISPEIAWRLVKKAHWQALGQG
jgi:hypothetical protein